MKNRLLTAASLLFWGLALLYFYFSGRLGGHRGGAPYLVPGLQPLVAGAGLLLVALAVGAFLRRPATGALAVSATPRRGGGATQLLAFLVMNLPVATALCVTQDGFGAGAVRNRGVATDLASLPAAAASGNRPPASSPGVPAPLTPPAPAPATATTNEPALPGDLPAPEDDGSAPTDIAAALPKSADGHLIVNVVDLLMAAEDDTLRPQFEGKTVEVVGQFMPPDAGKETDADKPRFRLVRMFMVCCAADARPVAVNVESPQPAKLAEMAWTKVVGTVAFSQEGERHNVVVRSRSATVTEPPKEAMLF